MSRIDNPIRPGASDEEWLQYHQHIVELLNDIYLARHLCPDNIRRLCKQAESRCRRKKDKKIFLMIRKHANPRQLLDDCYKELMAVIDVVVA